MNYLPCLALALACAQAMPAAASDAGPGGHAIWSIAGTPGHVRWIVIHNPVGPAAAGIYHIEVLQRARGAPAWQVERLARHMAVTEAALARSVIAPKERGAVYPEPFDDAYRQWRAEGRGGAVCRTSVSECLSK